MSLHVSLQAYVEREHAAQLSAPPRLSQDALTLFLVNGVILSVRYAATDAYSLRWRVGPEADAPELGIDTALTHPQLATVPNHLHLADGQVVADPVSRVDAEPEANLSALIAIILDDPLMQRWSEPA